MPRKPRIVAPGVPHHVTQRGTRRLPAFFEPADNARYIDLVAEGCRAAHVEVLAYCLMPHHVHFVLVPETTDGLTRAHQGQGKTSEATDLARGGKTRPLPRINAFRPRTG